MDTTHAVITDVLAPDKLNRQWVARNGSKVPLRADMRKADVTNSDDWSTYDQISAAIAGKPDLGHGLVLTPPYVGIDLDTYKTTDSQIISIHRWIHDELFAGTYSELSPHDGVHILCKGKIDDSRNIKQSYLEIYDEDRYFTYTGKALHYFPIVECQSALDQLCSWINQYYPLESAPNSSIAHVSLPATQSDDEVYAMAAGALNGELFKELYVGNCSGYPSQSEADFALVDIIAFYTDSHEQVERIFHQSELGKREKAYRPDYLWGRNGRGGIIRKAFDKKLPVLDMAMLLDKQFEQIRAGAAAPAATHNGGMLLTSQTTPTIQVVSVPEQPTVTIDFKKPAGLLGDIADFIYNSAPYPNTYVALAGAIAFFAGLTGRAYNTVTGTGLNQYIILLAESGIGKEAAASGTSRLCSVLSKSVPKILNYMGPGEIASVPALMKRLSSTQSLWSYKSEIGIWFQKLNSPNAKPYEIDLRRLLLDLFHKSGRAEMLGGTIYAAVEKNVAPIYAPAFTLYGDSTPNEFYDSIEESHITDGFVSRLTIISCPDQRPVYNSCADDYAPPQQLTESLERLIKQVIAINEDVKRISRVDETTAAKAFQLEYQKSCQDKQWKDRSKLANQIWSRAHIRLLRLGSLIAVGKSCDCPIVELADYQWAQTLIEHGIDAVIHRFDSGDVGHTTLGFKQRQAVENLLKAYVKRVWDRDFGDTYQITEIMHKLNIIPKRYIHNRLFNTSAFTKDTKATLAFDYAVNSFVSSGALEAFNLKSIEPNSRGAVVYKIIVENLPTD